jgi:hypothetical protein
MASASLASTPASPARRSAVPSVHPAAAKATPKARGAAADSASMSPEHAAARTLEDIHIEGEIPVPQVLFITAREQRRFMEFQHHRYLKSSRDVGAATVPPSRIIVSRAQTPPERSHPDD